MVEVRKATAVDVVVIAAALARAFDDDPMTAWVFPDEATRRRHLARFFAAYLRKIVLRHDEVYTTPDDAGAALWEPPGCWQVGIRGQLRLLPAMVGLLGRRLPTVGRGWALIESRHPRQPAHWYLATLGTEPARQGHGVGSALMGPVLERCDQEGVPAYLESSKESNLAFYARFGFEVTGEIDVPDGPRLWPMWREPR